MTTQAQARDIRVGDVLSDTGETVVEVDRIESDWTEIVLDSGREIIKRGLVSVDRHTPAPEPIEGRWDYQAAGMHSIRVPFGV